MDRLQKDLDHMVAEGLDSGALYKRVCKYLRELVAYRTFGLTPERVAELAQAEADNSSPGAGWISVKEPPDLGGGFYLVWTRNTGVEKCRWSEKHRRWMGGKWTEQITHWMPMPVPPKEVADR